MRAIFVPSRTDRGDFTFCQSSSGGGAEQRGFAISRRTLRNVHRSFGASDRSWYETQKSNSLRAV